MLFPAEKLFRPTSKTPMLRLLLPTFALKSGEFSVIFTDMFSGKCIGASKRQRVGGTGALLTSDDQPIPVFGYAS